MLETKEINEFQNMHFVSWKKKECIILYVS